MWMDAALSMSYVRRFINKFKIVNRVQSTLVKTLLGLHAFTDITIQHFRGEGKMR